MSATAEDPAGAQPPGTDTTSQPGGAQAPETAPVPQTEAEWEAALEQMDGDQLGTFLATPPAPPAAKQEEPPAATATPETEEEEEEEEPAPPPPPADPPAALERPGAPSRIRLNGIPAEQASKVAQYVEAVRSGKSPEEAAAILAPPAPAATTAPAPAAPESAPPPQPVAPPAVPQRIADLQEKITAAEQALQTAQESYDAVEISKATVALNRLELDLREAKAEAREQQANTESYNRQFDSHVTSLRAAYPDLDDENSPISIRLDELRDLEAVRNPGFDNDPAFILRLAAKAAQDVGARSAAATPVPQPTSPGKPRGKTAPGGAPVAKAMTADEANRQFDQVLAGMGDEEAADFLSQILPIPN